MKRFAFLCVGALISVLISSTSAQAALVTGPAARTQFENFATTLGDTFENFDGFATGLYNRLGTLPFSLETTEFRYPQPTVAAPDGTRVSVFTRTGSNRQLMGVRAFDARDGQSKYELMFDSPQRRAAVLRPWSVYSLTRFYAGPTLLAEHQNTVNTEFVGYISNSDEVADWITRIEFDGISQTPQNANKLYQVGAVDDLFFGTTPVPLPAAAWLLGGAIVSLLRFARRVNAAGEANGKL